MAGSMDPETAAAAEAYERRVMEREPGEPVPDDLEPPEGYEMSDAFRQWLVDSMRREVLGQVSEAGLDRMAVVKAPDAAADPEEE